MRLNKLSMMYLVGTVVAANLAIGTTYAQSVANIETSKNTSVAIAEEHFELVPKGTVPVAVTKYQRNNQEYTSIKYRDAISGALDVVTYNEAGNSVSLSSVPSLRESNVGDALMLQLTDPTSRLNLDKNIQIQVAVSLDYEMDVPPQTQVDINTVTNGDNTRYFIGDKEIQESEVEAINAAQARVLETAEENNVQALNALKAKFLQLNAIDQSREVTRDTASDTLYLLLTGDEVRRIISNDLSPIDHIDLDSKPSDAIDQAMQWSEIWSHAGFGQHQGHAVGLWQTEPTCAENNAVANYTASGTDTNHALRMAHIIRNVTNLAPITCEPDSTLPTLAQANAATPFITLVSHSAALLYMTNSSTGYLNRDRNWDNRVYSTGITIATAASNEGTLADFAVGSPGRGVNVITVGNVDIDASPDVIHYTSSWRNSDLGNEKPEISAPGHGTTLPGFPTSEGTSSATAHTGGFIANLIDSNAGLFRNAARTKAVVLAGATQPIIGGLNKAGVGGIDYRDTSQHYSSFSYSGFNNEFDAYDAADGNADGWITETVWLNTNKPDARAVITWLSRGTYVFNNDELSADFDLEVFAPNGSYVGGSHSTLNPFESFDFTVTTSGNYQFRIRRASNNDTNANLNLALAINVDD